MTDKKQPEALRLADALAYCDASVASQAAAELRRLHAENTTLQAGYSAARLEIESLKAQSPAAHGEHAELRRLSDCCPELNLSNYGPDDVDELNGWAIEVSQCIDRALAAQPAGAQQPGAAYAALPDALEALQLKSCPCGATPTALQITGDEQAKWAHVSGNCCGEWEIEYRNDYTKLASAEAMTLAAAAWNEAPRAFHGQAPAQAAPPLPERDASVPAERQGLFRKFDVRRVDGTDKPGGKHHGCTYFVLDVDHDPCARPALVAYAAACETTHPALSTDLLTKWGAQPVPAGYSLVPVEPSAEMVDAAQEAYMPFGDMQLAIQLAIEAEVRKQDDALILQLLEALEQSHATLWEEDDDPERPANAAIAAARARLEGNQ